MKTLVMIMHSNGQISGGFYLTFKSGGFLHFHTKVLLRNKVNRIGEVIFVFLQGIKTANSHSLFKVFITK